MTTPHKHAALIHAWADGAEIEFLSGEFDEWRRVDGPSWDPTLQYRIKPQPVVEVIAARVEIYPAIYGWVSAYNEGRNGPNNIRLTWTDGKLTGAEVL